MSEEDYPTWVYLEGKEDICMPPCDIIKCMRANEVCADQPHFGSIVPCYKDYDPLSLLRHLGKLSEEVMINKLRTRLGKVNIHLSLHTSLIFGQ